MPILLILILWMTAIMHAPYAYIYCTLYSKYIYCICIVLHWDWAIIPAISVTLLYIAVTQKNKIGGHLYFFCVYKPGNLGRKTFLSIHYVLCTNRLLNLFKSLPLKKIKSLHLSTCIEEWTDKNQKIFNC